MPRLFGTTATAQAVHRVEIADGDLSAAILTHGAVLQEVRLAGVPFNLTIGSPDLGSYEGRMGSCGAIVGPVANRIAGAEAEIAGVPYRFETEGNGPHLLHGGAAGLHRQVWEISETGAAFVVLHLTLPDGQGGFPGTRALAARFDIVPPATLRLTLTATTDAPTLINLANHSYWRMSDAPTTAGQVLTIQADHYLPTDEAVLPTGEIAPVTETRFDYRTGKALEAGAEGLIDTNFCLSQQRVALRSVATLAAPEGLSMEMATTEPGLQVFDGHILGLPEHRTTDGLAPTAYGALALEAQFWPNAPHNPDFPSIMLASGDVAEQITEWRFSKP